MKRALTTVYLILSCVLYSHSQNFTITGKIVDATNKEALEYATVTFKPKGSSDLIGGITDRKGKFEISVPKGKYTIIVEFLSYKTKIFKSQKIENDVHYGSIELSEDIEFLIHVEIVGKKKLIDIKPKKTVYNVSEDTAAEGSMITDVLNNIPSITFENGIASVRGLSSTVMINGKVSSLSKGDALKSLPAGSVEKIELITNPGAEYKASYKSIINIILKKGKDEGLNASITSQLGYKDIYGGLLTLNYKTKKINFFTNTSYGHRNPIQISNAKNEYFSGGSTTSYLNESSKHNSKEKTLISTIGSDFFLSKKTTLTTSINYTNLNYKSITTTNSSILDATFSETSFNTREHESNFDDEIFELTTEIEHNFNKEGRSLSSYFKYNNDVESFKNNVLNTNANYTNEWYYQKNKILNNEFNVSYTSPLTKKTSYSIGYNADIGKVPFRNSSSNRNVDYSREVHAGFVKYEYGSDKFFFDVGVRGEFSKATIDYLDLNITQELGANEFFPEAAVQYLVSDTKILTLWYQKSIERPELGRLQPFEEKFSETSSYIGNEVLKHMTIHSYSLDYSYYGDKLTIIPSLVYSKYNDWWQDVTYETGEQIDGVSKLITTPQNVGSVNYYGLNFTALYKVNNQLNVTFNSVLYIIDQHGVFTTTNTTNQPIIIDYNKKTFNGNFKLITQLKIPKVVNIQTSIFHRLKSEGPVSTLKAKTYASLAMNKDLFDKKATLSLSVNDLFDSNETKRDRFSDNYFSNSVIKDKPEIVLAFTYRFNQSKKNREVKSGEKDTKPHF